MALICRCGFVEISLYPVAARSIFCKYTTIFYQMQVNVLFFFKILLNTALICKQFAYPISLYVVKQRVSCCFFVNILVVINGSSVRKNKKREWYFLSLKGFVCFKNFPSAFSFTQFRHRLLLVFECCFQ